MPAALRLGGCVWGGAMIGALRAPWGAALPARPGFAWAAFFVRYAEGCPRPVGRPGARAALVVQGGTSRRPGHRERRPRSGEPGPLSGSAWAKADTTAPE